MDIILTKATKGSMIITYLKQAILLFVLIACASPAFAQIDEGSYKGFKIKDKEELPDVIGITVFSFGNGITQFTDNVSKKPLQGKYHIIVHQNKYYVGDFKKGIVDGTWEMYWYGDISEKWTFKNGKPDGNKYRYSSDGLKDKYPTVMTYKEGLPQHYIAYHRETGQIRSEWFYDETGMLNGEMFEYNKDGNVVEENRYLHGKRDGKQMAIDSYGYKTQSEYSDGVLTGEYTRFYPNGNISEKGFYDNKGKKTGQWKYGKEKGNITVEECYLNDKLNGKRCVYFENGQLKDLVEYKDGEINGKYIYYDENPYAISHESTYVDGRMNGEFKVYSKGVLWREGTSRDGKTVYEKVYENGKLQVVRILDENDDLVNVEQFNSAGKKTYQNKTYKNHPSIKLKENSSGIIDIE